MRSLAPLLSLLVACHREPEPDPGLSAEALAALVRPGTPEAALWAVDARAALVAAGQIPDEDHACQVFAIVEQESGYVADPAVPDLGAIAERELEAEAKEKLGPLAAPALKQILDVTPEGATASFRDRLRAVRTERDLDRLFREIVSYHESRAPPVAAAAKLLFPHLLERLNPVRTAGSMQVAVTFAQDAAKGEGLDPELVRELLYTRRGGLEYGVRRLFDVDADYDDPVYRFADYNAGQFASRNAEFQAELAAITELSIAPDGDLLRWKDNGKPDGDDSETLRALLVWRASYAPDLSEDRVRKDVKHEKERAFEETETWTRVRLTYAERTGHAPAYARLPDVALDSPKLAKPRTTRWFAESVAKRYTACRARG